MRERQTVCITDVRTDTRAPQEAYAATFVRSVAMAPIGSPEPIAALGAYWSQPTDHDQEAVRRLGSLARLATIAIENARLARQRDSAAEGLRASETRLRFLSELERRLFAVTDATAAMQAATHMLGERSAAPT